MVTNSLWCTSGAVKLLVPSSVHLSPCNVPAWGDVLKFNRKKKQTTTPQPKKKTQTTSMSRAKERRLKETPASAARQSQTHYSRNSSIYVIKRTNLWHSTVSMHEFNNVPWVMSIRLINQRKKGKKRSPRLFQEVGHKPAKPRGDGEACVHRVGAGRSWLAMMQHDFFACFHGLVCSPAICQLLHTPHHVQNRRGKKGSGLRQVIV